MSIQNNVTYFRKASKLTDEILKLFKNEAHTVETKKELIHAIDAVIIEAIQYGKDSIK